MTVKEGVECDVYEFLNDATQDLAIVRVRSGCKTPLQRILLGTKTIEGYVSGEAKLVVTRGDGTTQMFKFGTEEVNDPVIVNVGDIMQWESISDLIFFEICEPPYEDGRYENLADI